MVPLKDIFLLTADRETCHQILPHWSRCSELYKFRQRKQCEKEEEEERRKQMLKSLLITFRGLMSDLDLNTWLAWCEVR
jgi:hypothetical protein